MSGSEESDEAMTADESQSQGMAVAAPPFKRARRKYSQSDDSTTASSNNAAPSQPASSSNDGLVQSVSGDLDEAALSAEMENALVGDPDAVPAQPPTQSPPEPTPTQSLPEPKPEMTEVIAAPESGMPDAPTPGLIDPGSGSAG